MTNETNTKPVGLAACVGEIVNWLGVLLPATLDDWQRAEYFVFIDTDVLHRSTAHVVHGAAIVTARGQLVNAPSCPRLLLIKHMLSPIKDMFKCVQ